MEREHGEPLRVKLQCISVREADALPKAMQFTDDALHRQVAGYTGDWNLMAEAADGESVPISLRKDVEDGR
jgi:hypothetical protein